jgi:hypothetical protein
MPFFSLLCLQVIIKTLLPRSNIARCYCWPLPILQHSSFQNVLSMSIIWVFFQLPSSID